MKITSYPSYDTGITGRFIQEQARQIAIRAIGLRERETGEIYYEGGHERIRNRFKEDIYKDPHNAIDDWCGWYIKEFLTEYFKKDDCTYEAYKDYEKHIYDYIKEYMQQ